MEHMGLFCLTMLVAAFGGYVGKKLRIPAGMMVVSMVLVGILNAGFGKAYFYDPLTKVVQILAGILVGSKLDKKAVSELRKIILPTGVLVLCMMILNVCASLLIIRFSPLDLTTAMFASAPGGMADMTIMSADFGANSAYVAIIQVSRQLAIFLFMPSIIRLMNREQLAENAAKMAVEAEKETEEKPVERLLIVAVIAAVSSLVCIRLDINGGAIIGSMVASGVYCATGHSYPYPDFLKNSLQVLTGAYTGLKLTREVIQMLPVLGIPILCVMSCILIFAILIARIVERISGIDRATCMLASTPGGLSEMSLLSEELGADTVKIASMQTVRMFSVILLFPPVISGLLELLSRL
ncbi:MAG: AbrB family transcriptional regulator [Clostridiales bacterium]|nr:AbrB family transcriptional regulator [Clostridiales bacterium]